MADSGASQTRVTQTDVARAAGVSRSVVSFVLNGRKDQRIAQETATHVLAIAEQLGYRPNKVANTLRSGKSGTIAFVSDFVTTTNKANGMIKGALAAARAHNTLMITAETLGQENSQELLLNELLDHQVDGIIYAAMFTREVTVPQVLSNIPHVLLNCLDSSSEAESFVIPDEYRAGQDAARLLLDTGHTDSIYFIGTFPGKRKDNSVWPHMPSIALPQRLAGISDSLKTCGYELADCIDVEGDWIAESGYKAIQQILKKHHPSALICANDDIAFGAYQAAAENGLRIPEDLSIVSFDGSSLSRALRPQLTSLALPHEEMGIKAANYLLQEHNKSEESLHEYLPMPIIAGNSIGQPNAK